MKKIFQYIVSLSLFLIPIVSNSTTLPISQHWVPIFFGGGGTFPMVFPDLEYANHVFLTSDVAGKYNSINQGTTWNFQNSGVTSPLESAIAQAETNPDIVYSIGADVEKSINDGATWTTVGTYKATRDIAYKVIAIDRNNPNVVYIGLDNGNIIKTTDGGNTWNVFATPFGATSYPTITFVYINKASTVLIVGSKGLGMGRYDLVGNTNSNIQFNSETNGLYNRDFGSYFDGSHVEHFCTGAGLHIDCSSDGGLSWVSLTNITNDTTFEISRLAVEYISTGTPFVRFLAHGRRVSTPYGTNVDVWSEDGGITWTSFYNNITTTRPNFRAFGNFGVTGNAESIAFDHFNPLVAYYSTDGGVDRSTDGGHNWVDINIGNQNVVVTDVEASPNGILFACGMDFGSVYSTDNGVTWNDAIPNGGINSPQGFTIGGHYWRILTTGNAAAWNSGNGHVLVASSPYNNSPQFVPTIWRSVNNGVNWTDSSTGLPTTTLNASTGSDDPNAAAWGIGYPRSFAKSANEGTIYVGIDGYSSTELGGVFKSTDDGQTWHRTTQPGQWKMYHSLSVDPTDPTGNTAFYAEFFQQSGYTPDYWKTTDGGNTWNDVGVVNYGAFNSAYGPDGKAYVTGLNLGPAIFNSSNASTWGVMYNFNSSGNIADGIYVDPLNPNRVFAGIVSGIGVASVYETIDAQDGSSAKWYNITYDLGTMCGVQSITINYHEGRQGFLYIGTNGGGVFKLDLSTVTLTTASNIKIGL